MGIKTNTLQTTSTANDSIKAGGGATIEKRVIINDTTEATTTTDGSVATAGGGSFAKNVVVGGDVFTTAWTSYGATSTVTGWSVFTRKIIYYKRVGKLVFVQFNLEGTSDTNSIKFTLPFTNSNADSNLPVSATFGLGKDNGTSLTSAGRVQLNANSDEVIIQKDLASGAWTTSGTKQVIGQFWYEAKE